MLFVMTKVIRQVRKALRPVKRYSWLFWQHVLVPPYVRFNYWRVKRRIRRKQGKIRVLFPIHELAKWKCQSVFDLMKASDQFEPIMALSGADTDWASPRDVVRSRHRQMREFFDARGMQWVETYDIEANRCKSFREFKPDIVFYSQPWGHDFSQIPSVVSRYALTYYVPYFVPNYSSLYMEISHLFHCTLTRYFVLNKMMADEYGAAIPKWMRTSAYIPVGHPMLDYFTEHKDVLCKENYVIYAPHWSIDHPNNSNNENYSTFLDTGRFMLDFAQRHPEFKWVFKPHPTLRFTLLRTGAWTDREVAEYYQAWEKLGVACYTADYPALFMQSRLLITDCGSFLAEYSSTGRPLIRLVSPTVKLGVKKFNERLFNSFYNTKGITELEAVLDQVLIQNEDLRRNERLESVKSAGLSDSHASVNIYRYLVEDLEVRHERCAEFKR